MRLEPIKKWTANYTQSEHYFSFNDEIAAIVQDIGGMFRLTPVTPKGECLRKRTFLTLEAAKKAAEEHVLCKWEYPFDDEEEEY